PVRLATRPDPPVRPAAPRIPVVPRRAPVAEPTVHISIGRVEVRATAEPGAPSRAPASGRPRLSLDDYLRGRAGGDRR
ncbi:MAG TPA: hypothetical protein VGX25_00110, partial [Actinophytocola sp.]|uniref:hypothetical protein n=1 Tax=Actinophytocola sp. TaxID=1872138 RepID=UPI002DDC9628